MLHNKLCFLACLLTFTGTHSFNVLSNDHSSCKSTAATAHRFPNNQKSFRKDKIIGLGGGIEYAFDYSFCNSLKPSLRDDGVTCSQLKLATHRAFAKWSAKHPTVFFIRVKNPDDAEVVLGTFSRTKAKARFQARFSQTKEEERQHRRQTFHVGAVSHETLKSSPLMIAFAGALPQKLQTGVNDVVLKKTNGKQFYVTPQRKRIMVDAERCFYLREKTGCYDRTLSAGEGKTKQQLTFAVAIILLLYVLFFPCWYFIERRKLQQLADEKDQDANQELRAKSISRANMERALAFVPDPAWQNVARLKRISMENHLKNAEDKRNESLQHLIQEERVKVKFRWSGIGLIVLFLSSLVVLGFITKDEFECDTLSSADGKCIDFHSVMAHEMGHVLGLDHSDTGRFLASKLVGKIKGKEHDTNVFTKIDGINECKGLQYYKNPSKCTTLSTRKCQKSTVCRAIEHQQPSCKQWKDWFDWTKMKDCFWDSFVDTLLHWLYNLLVQFWKTCISSAATFDSYTHGRDICQSVFDNTMMSSFSDRENVVDQMSNDDVAGLFFLYPSKSRSSAWSQSVPLKKMSKSKLKFMASCAGVPKGSGIALSKAELANKINIHVLKKGLRSLSMLDVSALRLDQQEMDDAERISNLQRQSDRLFGRKKNKKNDADNEDVLRELLNEFQQTRDDIENENVKDSIVVGRVGDMNGDGVSDVDDDGDGLPNIVDEGLDALRELLDEISMEDVVREVGEDTNTVMMSNEEQAEAELEALYEALNDDDVLEGFRVSEDEETIKARNAERATGRGGGGSSTSEL